jgi:dTDP-4-amino-4,6-dideoxygalactose transaminase
LDINEMKPLFVAKPLLPELSDLTPLLQRIWTSQIVTNQGPLHNELEAELATLFDVPVSVLFNNGTSALQCALLALDLPQGSEVITTPLTFAATAHAITASGLTPVFADIDEDTLTLDPEAVARAITSKTRAVIGVHVYGTICDHARLAPLCREYDLYLAYDAAHAFASSLDGQPVAQLGDMNIFSLHATKLFNTFEGGLITSSNEEFNRSLRLVRNFGIVNEERVEMVGINGKMSELNAAIGLLNLKIFEQERSIRTKLRAQYDAAIDGLAGITKQVAQSNVQQSEQYYMVRVNKDAFGFSRDDVYEALKKHQIMSRRYFWPICTDFESYRGMPIITRHKTSVVERVKNDVLCLPFHSGVEDHHVATIAQVFHDLKAKARVKLAV